MMWFVGIEWSRIDSAAFIHSSSRSFWPRVFLIITSLFFLGLVCFGECWIVSRWSGKGLIPRISFALGR